jgi:hypothetical protein
LSNKKLYSGEMDMAYGRFVFLEEVMKPCRSAFFHQVEVRQLEVVRYKFINK